MREIHRIHTRSHVTMFRQLTLAVAVAVVVAAAAASAPLTAAADALPTTFACNDGTTIVATWHGQERATLVRGDETVGAERAPSGSGARYVADGVELWNKGDDATVQWRGAELTCRAAGGAVSSFAERLDAFVEGALERYGVPGAGVIVIHGEERLVRPYGVRRAGTDTPVDTDTRFAIASVTKAMTADLAAIAVDRGALEWDAPVVRQLSGLELADEHATRHVTVRQLLAHAGGFPAHGGNLLDAGGFTPDEVLERLRHLPLVAPLGTEAHYSNPGVFIAGHATARALGAPSYLAALERELFAPLAMTASGFDSGPIPAAANLAWPHLRLEGRLTSAGEIEETAPMAPASAVVTSLEDLGNWLEMHAGGGVFRGRRILSEDAIVQLGERVILEEIGFAELPPISEASGFAYSPGWGVFTFQNRKVLEKGGARGGYRAVAVWVPAERLAIGVVCNLGASAFPEAVRAWVLEELLGNAGGKDLQEAIFAGQQRIDDFLGAALVPARAVPGARPDLPLASYAGDYDNPLYGTLHVTVAGGGLRWSIGAGHYGGAMLPQGYNSFLLAQPEGVLAGAVEGTFLVDAARQPLLLRSTGWGDFSRVGEGGEPAAP